MKGIITMEDHQTILKYVAKVLDTIENDKNEIQVEKEEIMEHRNNIEKFKTDIFRNEAKIMKMFVDNGMFYFLKLNKAELNKALNPKPRINEMDLISELTKKTRQFTCIV